MPIRILIETKNVSFPDQGTPQEYRDAINPVLDQVNSVIAEFAKNRIDRKVTLTDRDRKACGEIEILRF